MYIINERVRGFPLKLHLVVVRGLTALKAQLSSVILSVILFILSDQKVTHITILIGTSIQKLVE